MERPHGAEALSTNPRPKLTPALGFAGLPAPRCSGEGITGTQKGAGLPLLACLQPLYHKVHSQASSGPLYVPLSPHSMPITMELNTPRSELGSPVGSSGPGRDGWSQLLLREGAVLTTSVHLALSAYPPLQWKELRRAGANPHPRSLSPSTEAPLQWFTRPLLRPPSLTLEVWGVASYL